MKHYRVKDEYLLLWTDSETCIVSAADIEWLSREWSVDTETLMKQVDEIETGEE